MNIGQPAFRALVPGLPFALLAASTSGLGQATVTVDVSRPLNVLTAQLMGTYAQISDPDLLNDKSLAQMRAAGIYTIAYPGGWDGVSQLYHWNIHRITPKAGNADAVKTPYLSPGNDFGHVAAALGRTGMSAIVYVNYGSNGTGSGGGEPKEAAAWVAYANGDPGNPKAIGTDSTGEDWKTVGFWASLRASAPIGVDDGYNELRIAHAQSLHLTMWQIGENAAQNGYYGSTHSGTFDLHAPYPAATKENDKRRKLKELSPQFYADRLADYALAMKAVDPDIRIGASLTTPTVDTWASDWNDQVLKGGCKDIDFVAFDWHPGGALPPDWKLLDDASVLHSTTEQLPKIVAETLYEYKNDCPARKVPRLVLSQVSPASWPKVENAMVKALFAADLYAALGESGIANAGWFQWNEDGLLDKTGKPNPAYYGMQMIHIVAFKPGDTYLAVKGAPSSLAVHATRRQDGVIGVALINQDPKQAQQVRLNIVGGVALADTAVRFDYGSAQQSQGLAPVRSQLQGCGPGVVVNLPANAIVDLLLPVKN